MEGIEILKVMAIKDKDTGELRFAWKFGGNINPYTLTGLLDSIKNDLLTQLQEKNFKENDNERYINIWK